MFGKKWPSIRLGLLTPGKYIAVLNTFSKDCDRHDELLQHMNTVDLLKCICGRTAFERIRKKREQIDTNAQKMTELVSKRLEIVLPELPLECNEKPIMRSEAGLGEFQHPSYTCTIGDLHMNKSQREDLENFQVTGFESEGLQMARRDHFLCYPSELRLRSFPRGVFCSYPPPFKDQNGIPSWWLLDGGSLVPVLALGLEKGESLLDLCAAPGGKSLLSLLTKLPSKVVCNDFKLARLGMLKRALSTYVPIDSPVSDIVILKRSDASNLATWDEINVYDKVLADVPCSTDRLAVTQDEGNMFSPKMTNERLNLPQIQTKILM
ncbi:hypothetical protein DICVIV_08847 [Dictyocaulus viviparus]|uniref:NOL1/NOP2/Sun domain family member 4 n=1 Tax=Dictyocaulus viviparus TaxID=29172 RepID=A0A0D8XRV5_DICVI|nr:hypothetical protein DICVIV_08847 [Dictyocaulus viviparus]